GKNEKVVGDFPIGQDQRSALSIHADDLGKQHFDVFLVPENPADTTRDTTRRERRACHLIQQRLKEVVVPAIEKRHLDWDVSERTSGVQAAESAADNHDMHLSTILEFG